MGLLDIDFDKMSVNPLIQMGLGILANSTAPRGTSTGAMLGKGALQGMENVGQARQAQFQQKYRQMQMDDMTRKMLEEQKAREFLSGMNKYVQSPAQQALASGEGPTVGNATEMAGLAPRIDLRGMYGAMSGSGVPSLAMQGMQGLGSLDEAAAKRQEARDMLNLKLMESKEAREERLAAQREMQADRLANQRMIAQMGSDTRRDLAAMRSGGGLEGNLEKPLTATQEQKLRSQMGTDRKMVGQIESDASFIKNAIKRLEEHPGLSGMTGWQAYFPSAPETAVSSGKAKGAETILSEIKGRTATLGRQIASQSGKLGNMAVQEWKIVADSLAALDPASPEFKNQLGNLAAQVEGLEARTKEGYQTTYEPYLERWNEFKLGDIPKTGQPSSEGMKFDSDKERRYQEWKKSQTGAK